MLNHSSLLREIIRGKGGGGGECGGDVGEDVWGGGGGVVALTDINCCQAFAT